MIPILSPIFSAVSPSKVIKGSYILCITLEQDIQLEIGSLGINAFKKGYYLYIGSALGSGGLTKRVERHLKNEKKLFWHIDYFLNSQYTKVVALAWKSLNQKIECQISQTLDTIENIDYIPNFGSSDCNCTGHLKIVKVLDYNSFLSTVQKVIIPFAMTFNELK